MKPKKKVMTRSDRSVRQSGYYWVKYGDYPIWFIAQYYPNGDYFMLSGNILTYYAEELSYISPTPLTPPKRSGQGRPITIPVTRSGQGKPNHPQMKTLLWLDDIRNPHENDWLVFSPIEKPYYVNWVKSYFEFIQWIKTNGLPDGICFDHDLGLDEVHEKKTMTKGKLKRFRKTEEYKTGYDCAKWLVEYCIEKQELLPRWNIQSANPIGKENINSLLSNYNKLTTP